MLVTSRRCGRRFECVALLAAALVLLSCAGSAKAPGLRADGRLAPCPSSPNCFATAFELAAPARSAWAEVPSAVTGLDRTRIVALDDRYLHAQATSALFRFVDDLELHLRPEAGVIEVRSASRVGYSDLGVNRRRVEALHAALERAGAVR